MNEFFKTSTGKKVEKYLWELAVISLGLAVAIIGDLNAGWVAIAVPILNQLTKHINTTFLKK